MLTSTLPFTTIDKVKDYENQEVSIKSWMYGKRSSGKIHFLLLRDGFGLIQAVAVKSELPEELFEEIGKYTQESSMIISGKVRKDDRAPGGYELTLTNAKLISLAEEYPISRKEHGTDFLMQHRHLWLRTPRQIAIMKIRDEIIKALIDYFDKEGYIRIDAPILTPSCCEGTTNLFETDYFDAKAYLTQSGQLYMEAAAMAFQKVYCFGPTFRAEKSKTRRHLMEFWMIEPEIAFIDLDEDMRIQEDMLTYVIHRVIEKRKEEFKVLERDTTLLENIKPPFPRISYDEACQMLEAAGMPHEWGMDLGGTDETVLTEKFNTPFFVHRFPAVCKAFYMKPDPANPKLALCADMLAPEGYGEIIGGGQRMDDLQMLEDKIKEHNLPREAYEWYIDLRKYGSVPHAGFGLGIERLVAWLCKLDHVRETIPFARMLEKIYP
jgi:asparaginyl-tRNA synthetase